MMPVRAIMLLLLGVAAWRPQEATLPPADLAKANEEASISCRDGRLLGANGTDPIGNVRIEVRDVKHSFPYPHLSIMELKPGKVVARLRVDQNGRFHLSTLKPGEYFFGVSVSEGKAGSVFQVTRNDSEQDCEVDLRVAGVESALVLVRSAS